MTETITTTHAPGQERTGGGPAAGPRRPAPASSRFLRLLGIVGRGLAAAARWLLLALLVVLGSAALIVWATAPRLTSPTLLVQEARALGLTELMHTQLLDRLSTQLAPEAPVDVPEGELRRILERHVTPAWFDLQLDKAALDLERWLNSTTDSRPTIVLDLSPVKRSLADDPEISALIEDQCSGPGCPEPDLVMRDLLQEVPDEVDLGTLMEESETAQEMLVDLRAGLQGIDRVVTWIPFALLLALTLLTLLARAGRRLRWLGVGMLAIALPALLITTLAPAWGSPLLAGGLPADAPIDRSTVTGALDWAVEPARTLALRMTAIGTGVLVAASIYRRYRTRLGR